MMSEYIICAYCGTDYFEKVEWFTHDGKESKPVCNLCAVDHKDEVYPVKNVKFVNRIDRLEKIVREIIVSHDCQAWTPDLLELMKELGWK